MKKKLYAVKIGRETGIFYDWEECKKQVEGFSGAKYKSFVGDVAYKEATDYLNEKEESHSQSEKKFCSDSLCAYTDGSFNPDRKRYGGGVVFLTNKQLITHTIQVADNKSEYVSSRNVAGETLAVIKAVQWAYEQGYRAITIYYDYIGIEKWITGEWRANTPVAISYRNAIDEMNNQIDIEFVKVPAHAGVKFNEMADNLAKRAVGIR